VEDIFSPAYFGRFGLEPSNPPWIGIINFLVETATLESIIPASNAVPILPLYGAEDGKLAAASWLRSPK
jgi:hypothetical protein